MKPLTSEWIEKAEGDFATAGREILVRNTPNFDAVCKKLGLRKNFVVEAALREKLEDLIDAVDLREAMNEATGFHAWDAVNKDPCRSGSK